LDIAIHTENALEYLHYNRIVHRNVKSHYFPWHKHLY